MVFLNKFSFDKPKDYLINDNNFDDSDKIVVDDIDDDLDTKLLTITNILTSIRISKSNVSLHNIDSKHS